MNRARNKDIFQFYLKQFVSPGWLYCRGWAKPLQPNIPKGITIKLNHGQKNEQQKLLDDIICELETEGPPILKRLENKPSRISGDDWIMLSYLFAILALGTPISSEESRATYLPFACRINEIAGTIVGKNAKAESKHKSIWAFTLPALDIERPGYILDSASSEAVKIQRIKGQLRLVEDMADVLPSVAECIQQMTFIIAEAPKDHFFLTSDRPLYLQSRRPGLGFGVSWADQDALGSIALSPSRFLIMLYYGQPAIYQVAISTDDVALFNFETIKFAHREVYSPFEYSEADDWMRGFGKWETKS